ncbi:MAG: diphthine--ammonia ligase [Defluviitaleaceae bacterium]|nr:diphthine--ammonia ligase [Defluviitaleaceae bacterium]
MSKKFVASYSGGKDSVLAIYRAIKQGHEPIALIITYNTTRNRSYFHGIPEDVLNSVSKSLDIPIWLIKTSGEEYAQNFEKTLIKAKELGAEMCIFGDIDIEGHREWCTARCENTGLSAFFPLWGEERKKLVYEFIETGFLATITALDTSRMSEDFIGNNLTIETVDLIESQGVDICGENGEYHTFVHDGPMFNKKVEFSFGKIFKEEKYIYLPILP